MAADGREEGAYLNRYVTDPAAAGQPPAHFRRTPPGVASWLFSALLTPHVSIQTCWSFEP
jgi:hypothetical protein